jgi:hypothetical protein
MRDQLGGIVDDEKEELIDQIQSVMGYSPIRLRELLNVLTQPGVIEFTKRYVSAMDTASQCQKYKAPWSCAKEAEAHYKNIKYGWLGAPGSGVGFNESWCEPCRRKVLDTA